MRSIIKSKLTVFLIIAVFFNYGGLGYAADLPQVAEVVSGTAIFSQPNANTLTENISANAIINYNEFNIGAQNTVNIMHDVAGASSLHRVIGVDASSIYGALNSNGKVFLINPNGVLFAPGSRVDAAGLVASTMGISNADFLAGKYAFVRDGANGSVVNEGQIQIRNGGYLALLAPEVRNAGAIEAQLGTVALASGDAVTLNLDDNGDISVVLDAALTSSLAGQTTGVKNAGSITADGGKVILTAKALDKILDSAINNSGVIQANSLVNKNGVIELVADGTIINDGTIKADGTNGGIVSIVAKGIWNAGKITANAFEGGKAGLVKLLSTDFTFLVNGSSIEAKATGIDGQGGEVILKSNGVASVDEGATIDVSGGLASGDAGFVELSADKSLGFNGDIIGEAAEGYNKSTVLFDPYDIVIINGPWFFIPRDSATSPDIKYTDFLLFSFFISPAKLKSLSASEVYLQALHNIYLESALTGVNKSIRFEALNDIELNADLGTNGYNITLTADANANGIGQFRMAVGKSVVSNGGDINISSAESVTAREINAGTGNVAITATNSDASINDDGDDTTKTRGNAATLIAGQDVGSSFDPLDTSVNSLSAMAVNGSIYAVNDRSVTVLARAASDFILTATGNILVGYISADDSVTLDAQDGSIFGLNMYLPDIDTKNLYLSASDWIIGSLIPWPGYTGPGLLTTTAEYIEAEAGGTIGIAVGNSVELADVTSHTGDVFVKALGDIFVDHVSAANLVALKAIATEEASGSIIGSGFNSVDIDTNSLYLNAGGDIYGYTDLYTYFDSETHGALSTNADNIEANAGGSSAILDDAETTLGNSNVGGAFIFRNLTGDINFNGTTTAGQGVAIISDQGNMNGVSSGAHVDAGVSPYSFLGTPNGTMGLAPHNPINVSVNSPLYIDVGQPGLGQTTGLLTGTVNDPDSQNFNAGVTNAPRIFNGSYPSPLYPMGNIFFGPAQIWPPKPGALLSQSAGGLIQKFLYPHAERLIGSQVNPMDLASSAAFKGAGPVYFYHPLSEVDSGSYNEFILEEGAYDFIDGQVSDCSGDQKETDRCKQKVKS